MANIIKPKRSNTASAVPTTGQLASGELAVNMADKKVYINNGTSVVQIGSGTLEGLDGVVITSPSNGQGLIYNGTNWVNQTGAGSGDVVGPASSTDNAITRYDGTTGKLIQNSTVTLDDDGNVINANSIGFDTTPTTPPTSVGTMSWDDGDGVPQVILKGGNVTLQSGTQEYARVYNDSGSTLTKGQVVYISGAQGNRVAIKLARADVEATSFGTIGLVAESIANGAEGFIIVSGALYKLDTTGLTAGATVYLSPTTAGAITTTKPQAPNQLVVIGWVERVDNIVGSIYVKIDNGYELDELHDVQITSPTSGNLLIYDASTSPIGVWKNANLTDGSGISITEGAGSITIANSGVTSITAGTGISTSGSTGGVTIDLANTTVTAGSYTYASITVDAQGRLTAASSGASPSAFAAGTAMIFAQTAAPTGWTKSTTHDNKALRVVTGTASSGGTVAFTTAFSSARAVSVSGTVANTTAGGSVSTTITNTTASGSVSTSVANTTATGTISTTVANTTATGTISTTTTVTNTTAGGTVGGTTLATSQIPSHNHFSGAGSFVAQGGSGANVTTGGGGYGLFAYSGAGGGGSHDHTFTGASHGHTASSTSTFTGTAHNHTATSTFTGTAHNHTASSSFTGTSHGHTASSSFTGTSHGHSFSGSGTVDLDVQYVDVIIATKD